MEIKYWNQIRKLNIGIKTKNLNLGLVRAQFSVLDFVLVILRWNLYSLTAVVILINKIIYYFVFQNSM